MGGEHPAAPTATAAAPPPSPQPPGSRSEWAPTAGPVGPGRPSKPGGPWEGEEQGQMDVAGRTSALVPTARGAPGRVPSPSDPGAWPRGTHQFPLLPRGAHVASLAFDALGKEGDEGPAQDRGQAGTWGTDGTWGMDGVNRWAMDRALGMCGTGDGWDRDEPCRDMELGARWGPPTACPGSMGGPSEHQGGTRGHTRWLGAGTCCLAPRSTHGKAGGARRTGVAGLPWRSLCRRRTI